MVPAGPDNPLGQYALRLGAGNGSYLIHGTNKPYGVGMRVTHGCVRMYPEDIERLFDIISVGTQVQLVNQPIKLGWVIDTLFIELHPPLDEDEEKYANYERMVTLAINDFFALESNRESNSVMEINNQALKQAIAEMSGMPVQISN